MSFAVKQRISVTALAQFKLQPPAPGKAITDKPCQGLEATQLLITLMEVLHPRLAPLGSFYVEYHITVSVAIKAEQGEAERGATLSAKWSTEMRIPSG